MSITLIFIFSFILAAIIFDIVIIAKKGRDSSISAYIVRGAQKYPLIPFLAGALCGHLFWSYTSDEGWGCAEVKNTETIFREVSK